MTAHVGTSGNSLRFYTIRGLVSILWGEKFSSLLEFERTWASFELPRYLMAMSRIQRALFQPRHLPFGDYSVLTAQLENLFTSPVAAALDEYGVPLHLAARLTDLVRESDNLDIALARMRRIRVSELRLDPFETELLSDAIEHLP